MDPLERRLRDAPERPWPAYSIPIALVITDLDIGGAERSLVALATALDRQRWSPSVIALMGPGALVEPLRAAGIETECLGVRRNRPWQAVARLAGALRRRRPRLVQSFLFHANIAARLAAPLAGVPWVVGGLRVAERGKGWHRAIDRLTSGLSTGSVCVSEGVQRFSHEIGGINPARLTVIPNAVDCARFDAAPSLPRDALGVPAQATLALFVGRIERQKGVNFLLDAFICVARGCPSAHLIIVGEGPERPALEARARSTPELAARVHWLGRRDDVPALIKAADLLVLPSLWEGMPNVVLEAMAARRAVVATAVEGSNELVVAGETGWLVPPGDAGSLGDSLVAAFEDRERLRRYGEAGRCRVDKMHRPEQVVRAYERLWAGILGYERDGLNG